MRKIKDILKEILIFLIIWTGILRLWRLVRRNRITILMIHGVMDEKYSSRWVPLRPQMSTGQLEFCITVLCKYYSFISLDEAIAMLNGDKPAKPNSIVITFDDGYRNSIKYAWPILKKYGVPATIFLSTGHIDNRKPFWFDRIDYALQQLHCDELKVTVGAKEIRGPSRCRSELKMFYSRLRDAAKALKGTDLEMLEELDRIAAELEKQSGKSLADIIENDDWSALLTWEEIKKAAEDGVSFGSHTIDHVRLSRVPDSVIVSQLTNSKERIEVETGVSCHFLCYPNGSYNQRAIKIARECGYKAAVTVENGCNSIGNDAMKLCRRHLPIEGSESLILATVSGLIPS